MSKQFLAVIVVVILAFVGVFIFNGNRSNTGAKSAGTPSNHIEGQGKDGVTLVEYGDYQCPYCGEYYPIVKQVVAQYSQQIYFQFRNFPLVSIHQNAFAGARAAEAASLQGKFWQMHDLLYDENDAYYNSNQTLSTWINSSNPETDFIQYASQLGLNVAKFQRDYASTEVNNVINADMAAGNKLGVNATPTFYLDGKQIQPTSYTVGAFQKFINAAIAQKANSAH